MQLYYINQINLKICNKNEKNILKIINKKDLFNAKKFCYLQIYIIFVYTFINQLILCRCLVIVIIK